MHFPTVFMCNEKDIKKDIKKVNNIVDLFLLSFRVNSAKGEIMYTYIPYDTYNRIERK